MSIDHGILVKFNVYLTVTSFMHTHFGCEQNICEKEFKGNYKQSRQYSGSNQPHTSGANEMNE